MKVIVITTDERHFNEVQYLLRDRKVIMLSIEQLRSISGIFENADESAKRMRTALDSIVIKLERRDDTALIKRAAMPHYRELEYGKNRKRWKR